MFISTTNQMIMHRLISEKYITTLLEGFLHFSPCDQFVDQLEFRFGYCRDSFELGGDAALAKCVRDSFNNPEVDRKIADTSISCWSRHPQERAFMWEVYGKSLPAILIASDDVALQTHVRQIKGTAKTSAGPVRYHFFTSQDFPEFLTPPADADLKADFDLFFHKHDFYQYEKEFRMVIAERGPVMVPLPEHLIHKVILSPFGQLLPKNLHLLRQKFAGRVVPSSIKLPYAASSLVHPKALSQDYVLDKEILKNPEVIELLKELKHWKAQERTKGWNDPEAPPIPKEQREVTRRIKETERRLNQAISAARSQ
jgi:hypothetical protein